MSKIKRLPTVDEAIHEYLGHILNEIRYVNPNGKGVRAAYYGRLVDLKKNCMRIVNAIESQEKDNG